MLITKDQILETITKMSVTEIMELVSMIEKKFNVSSLNEINIVDNKKEKIKEEKNEFNVIMTSIGSNKIAVIKAVRSIINLGLKEAKDLVESAPVTLKENLNKLDAESIKKKLEEVGATIKIQ